MIRLETLISELRPESNWEELLLDARDQVALAESPFYRAWFPSAITVLGLLLALQSLVLSLGAPSSVFAVMLIALVLTGVLLLALILALRRDVVRRDGALADARLRVAVLEALIDGRI